MDTDPTSEATVLQVLREATSPTIEFTEPTSITIKKNEEFDRPVEKRRLRSKVRLLSITLVTPGPTTVDGEDYPNGIFMHPVDVGDVNRDGIRYLFTIDHSDNTSVTAHTDLTT